MEKTTVYLPAELHRSLKEVAKRTKRPQAQLIREAVAKYVADQKPQYPWPKTIGIVSGKLGMSGVEAKRWAREELAKKLERELDNTR